jgi:hypothetical protein
MLINIFSRLPLVVLGYLFCTITITGLALQNRSQKTTSKPVQNSANLSARDIADIVMPTVVGVYTQDEHGKPLSLGSGFFYEDDQIITNLHVFKRASKAYIKILSTGNTYPISEIIGIDMEYDLCVLKSPITNPKKLTLGIGHITRVGDEVYVAGNPKGLEGTFTKGIVSSLRRSENLIQIDAAVSSGSSGGPVVNYLGHAIGVVVSTLQSGQNLNFAIPIILVKEIKLKGSWPVVIAGGLSLSDKDKDHLLGPVKSVKTSKASYLFDIDRDEYIRQEVKPVDSVMYDRNGNKIQELKYKPFAMTQFEYSRENLKLKYISVYEGREYTSVITRENAVNIKYQERNYSTSSSSFVPSPTGGFQITEKYDSNGDLIEQTHIKDGKTIKYIREYTEHRLVTQKVYENGVHDTTSRFSYRLDSYGNWIHQKEESLYSEHPEWGFTPFQELYREISYN